MDRNTNPRTDTLPRSLARKALILIVCLFAGSANEISVGIALLGLAIAMYRADLYLDRRDGSLDD